MNLDKMIRIKLIELSSKYDISLIEIQKPKDGHISRTINVYYRPIGAPKEDNDCETFHNKRDLVSWLVWLI